MENEKPKKKDEGNFWKSKCKYVNAVTGYQLAKIYNEMGQQKGQFVVAMTPFQDKKTKINKFDAFIYYKKAPKEEK